MVKEEDVLRDSGGMMRHSEYFRRSTRRLLTPALGVAFLIAMLFILGSRNKPKLSDDVHLSRLINVGLQLLDRAGRAVVEHRTEGAQGKQVKGMTREGKKEFVTQGDLKSHRILYGNLKMAFPGMVIVSEEHDEEFEASARVALSEQLHQELTEAIGKNGDSVVPLSDLTVWIDPLDATQEYTEQLDQYVTVMMCIVVRGDPIAGLVHFPFEGVTYWQWREHHFSKSFRSVAQKEASSERLKVIVSRSHAGKANETLRSAFGKNVRVIPAGGAGYKVMQLVRGSADLYVHTTAIKKWDICAGDSMLRHLGGRMSTLTGNVLQYGTLPDYKVKEGLIAARSLNNFETFREKLRTNLKL